MKDIGIIDDDLLAVHKTQDVCNGQVVVARLADDIMIKRLERKDLQVWLHSENEQFTPVVIDLTQQNVTIEGIIVDVVRRVVTECSPPF